MAERRRRLQLSVPPDERRPLLSRLSTEHENGEHVFSCRTNPHSDLPVYTNIHRIRRDIVSVVEDYLTLEQLRDVKINVTVIRPLVDKFYELGDVSIGTLPFPFLAFFLSGSGWAVSCVWISQLAS